MVAEERRRSTRGVSKVDASGSCESNDTPGSTDNQSNDVAETSNASNTQIDANSLIIETQADQSNSGTATAAVAILNRRAAQKQVAEKRAAHFARADPQEKKRFLSTTKSLAEVSSTPTGTFHASSRKKIRRTGTETSSSSAIGGATSSSGNIDEEEEGEEQQGERAAWPGPFSTARDILAKRNLARAEREARIAAAATAGGDSGDTDRQIEFIDEYEQMAATLKWDPATMAATAAAAVTDSNIFDSSSQHSSSESSSSKVQSLVNICAAALVHQFAQLPEHAFDCMPSEARGIIAGELAKRRTFDCAAALKLTPADCQAIVIPDCSCIDEDTFMLAVEKAAGCCAADETAAADTDSAMRQTGLSLLSMQMGNCGRVVCDRTAAACVNHIRQLELLELNGCYRLTDAALEKLLAACGDSLLTLQLQCNSRLSASGLRCIRSLQNLRVLNLDNAEQLTESDLMSLLPIPFFSSSSSSSSSSSAAAAAIHTDYGLRQLRSLSLANITALTDEFMQQLLQVIGEQLRDLSLRGGLSLTDSTLHSIREYCSHLLSLDLSHLPLLSDVGLMGLFISSSKVQALAAEMEPLQYNNSSSSSSSGVGESIAEAAAAGVASAKRHDIRLQNLKLSALAEAVSDEVLVHLCEGGSGHSLQHLDVSSCSAITSRGAAALLKHCSGSSLKELDISFVRGISEDVLGLLVESCQRHQNLTRLTVWGCSQLSDKFFAALQLTYTCIIGRMNA